MTLEQCVDLTIEKHKNKVDLYVNNNSKDSLNYLIGKALQYSDGKYNPDEIEKELIVQLETINSEVDFPIRLTKYYRVDDTSIGEKIANILRDELDVPLNSISIPQNFTVPELKLTYDVYDDGTVEFVEIEE